MNKDWRSCIFALFWAAFFTACGYAAVAVESRISAAAGIETTSEFSELLFFVVIGVLLVVYVRLVDGKVKEPLAIGPLRFNRIALAFAVATLAYQGVEILISVMGLASAANDFKVEAGGFRVLGAVNSAIMAPMIEELMFRGFVYNRVEKAAGALWAIILSGLAFAAFHGEGGLLYVAVMIPAGLFFSYARMKSGNAALPWAMHAWMNSSLSLFAYLLTVLGWK